MVFLFIRGVLILGIIGVVRGFIHKGVFTEERSFTPLEGGLATVRKIFSIFSVQRFFILILFLVLDLEVIFIISLTWAGGLSLVTRVIFLFFVVFTL